MLRLHFCIASYHWRSLASGRAAFGRSVTDNKCDVSTDMLFVTPCNAKPAETNLNLMRRSIASRCSMGIGGFTFVAASSGSVRHAPRRRTSTLMNGGPHRRASIAAERSLPAATGDRRSCYAVLSSAMPLPAMPPLDTSDGYDAANEAAMVAPSRLNLSDVMPRSVHQHVGNVPTACVTLMPLMSANQITIRFDRRHSIEHHPGVIVSAVAIQAATARPWLLTVAIAPNNPAMVTIVALQSRDGHPPG